MNTIKPVMDEEYSKYFNNLLIKYIKCPESDPLFNKEIDFFLRHMNTFEQNSKVLEIGCGSGRTILILATKGYECYGVDFDSVQIKYAEKMKNELNLKNIYFSVNQIGDSIYSPEYFNIVVTNDLVEHLPDNELINYFTQVYLLLKGNGLFLISSKPLKYTYLMRKKFVWLLFIMFFLPEKLFNKYLKFLDYILPRIYKFFLKKPLPDTWMDSPPGHCNPPDDQIISDQLRSCGFEIEELFLIHPGTYKFSKIVRKILRSNKLNTSIFIVAKKRTQNC